MRKIDEYQEACARANTLKQELSFGCVSGSTAFRVDPVARLSATEFATVATQEQMSFHAAVLSRDEVQQLYDTLGRMLGYDERVD